MVAGLAPLAVFAWTDIAEAAAHHRHRHHRYIVVHPKPHGFVFSSPQDADTISTLGQIDAISPLGIPGPSTADPYQRPAYGYDARGRYGRGYAYPGY